MASAHAPRRRRQKAGARGEGGDGRSGLAERRVSRRKLPKAGEQREAGGGGEFGRRRSESGSACEILRAWGRGGTRGARGLGVSAPPSGAGARRRRGRGGEAGGAPGVGCTRPGWCPPACGMGNEAFLRSDSITSFSSQEPAAATATT